MAVDNDVVALCNTPAVDIRLQRGTDIVFDKAVGLIPSRSRPLRSTGLYVALHLLLFACHADTANRAIYKLSNNHYISVFHGVCQGAAGPAAEQQYVVGQFATS